ncbi:hypothetical protein D0T49_12605 [Paludibacter sp. 221]|uniref:hypothetical protein n=1 Tax=Paludibacter sp. 221 TaxID=2302939 RepID=UPI0013D08146|nr:hypothetical protein [Paludibacter sp. 221]NDV47888.1 hypothetical protein [Paludibacter sp. 221]
MKRFIDEKGTFEITVPATWKYFLDKGKVHTFQDYQIWKSDTFQLSINELDTDEKKNNFDKNCNFLKTEKIHNENYFSLPDSTGGEFTVKSWMKRIDSKMVMFTLTYSNNPDPELDNRTLDEKISIVHSAIKSFRLIDTAQRNSTVNSYRFEMFLQGVGATSLILSNAISNKAFIEATCILASQIDALLRIGIVLKNQINNNNKDIEIEWIYQGLTDKKKSEKDIYKKALEIGIIDQSISNELYVLYDDRNRVIHRFIISEITLAEVEGIAYKYYKKQQKINKIIYDLETEQIEKNVGMTIAGKKESDDGISFIKGKIGINECFENKKSV